MYFVNHANQRWTVVSNVNNPFVCKTRTIPWLGHCQILRWTLLRSLLYIITFFVGKWLWNMLFCSRFCLPSRLNGSWNLHHVDFTDFLRPKKRYLLLLGSYEWGQCYSHIRRQILHTLVRAYIRSKICLYFHWKGRKWVSGIINECSMNEWMKKERMNVVFCLTFTSQFTSCASWWTSVHCIAISFIALLVIHFTVLLQVAISTTSGRHDIHRMPSSNFQGCRKELKRNIGISKKVKQ